MSLDDVPEEVGHRGACWVRVAVQAAGVSHIDTLLARGQFDCVPKLPFVPGLEVSGIVTFAPIGCGHSIGDHVVGYVRGGFAETVWAHSDLLAPLPSDLSFIEGAAVVVNFHAAVLALWRRAELRAGESVLVHGAGGGVGSAMVQVAKASGARVLAVAGSSARRAVAESAGADYVCRPDDWYDTVRGAGGVDVIIDPVGGGVLEQSLNCLAPYGRLVTVGCASNAPSRVMAEHLLQRNLNLLGISWPEMVDRERSGFSGTAKQLEGLIAKGLRPMVTRTYDLAAGRDALRAIEDRTSAGKLVLAVA